MKYTITLLLAFHFLFTNAQTAEQIKQVEDAKKMVKAMEGKAFPSYELTSINGNKYNSEELKGKVVLFNFWFTSCRPCVEELPEINSIVDEFGRDNVVYIAPTFEDDAKVNKFIKRFEMAYDPIADVKGFVLSNNVRSFPTHFVINQEGIVTKVVNGYSVLTDNMLKKAVRKLLK